MGLTRAIFQDQDPIDFLVDLHARGIRVTPHGDRLHIEAPRGAMTPELRLKILVRKPELLHLAEYKVTRLKVPSQNNPARFDVWTVAEKGDGWFIFWYVGEREK